MADEYTGAVRVTAPYVTLKFKDETGAEMVRGLYEGGIVENVEAESLKHHLDDGMVEKVNVAKDGTVTAVEEKSSSKSPAKADDKAADKPAEK